MCASAHVYVCMYVYLYVCNIHEGKHGCRDRYGYIRIKREKGERERYKCRNESIYICIYI